MLEKVDLTRAITKEEYKTRIPALQASLYELQLATSEAGLPSAPPEGEDKTHHYLWRFGRLRPPDEKQIQVFDRSWYGRVLGGAWRILQGGRLKARLIARSTISSARIRHTSVGADARGLAQSREWGRYDEAVGDMPMRTSTLTAPWTVVESNKAGTPGKLGKKPRASNS